MKSILFLIIIIPLFFIFNSFDSIYNVKASEENNLSIESPQRNTTEKSDILPPSINITNPAYPPTINTGNITIQGITNDSSGIRAVSASAHTFPYNGNASIRAISDPLLIPDGNFSRWSIPFLFNETNAYRVVIAVSDNFNNTNYTETTINVILPEGDSNKKTKPRIAFVRPTFTEAAYQEHGFYDFYFKYKFPPFGQNITTDLDMLTVKTPLSIPETKDESVFRNLNNITALAPLNGTELNDISFEGFPDPQRFWAPFIDSVKETVSNAIVTVMRDEDVSDGHIFTANNKTNAYDLLLLFHNEYVTQQEYDNFRQFVKNGGSIVFIDANVFYAEVKYDRNKGEITLVKGHDWEFDGKVAKRSQPERWYNETKGWVGGNFLVTDISTNITFANNPFNYTHFEEQFVNNPNAKIIIDYGIKFPPDYLVFGELPPDKKNLKDITIATYELEYGKGRTIMLGLFGENLANNETFMKFFEEVVLPKALCPAFFHCHSLRSM